MSAVAATARSRSPAEPRRHWLAWLVLAVFLVFVLAPILLVTMNSFKDPREVYSGSLSPIFHATLDNYRTSLDRLNIQGAMVRSLIVATSSTGLALLAGVPSAYALARLPMRHRGAWSGLTLFARMTPAIVLLIPMFVLFTKLKLTDSYLALILAHGTISIPLVIWMMRSFFEDLPVELEEAARVDGATRLQAFYRIALPLTSTGLAAAAIIAFLASWNEFLFANVLAGQHTQTAPLAIASSVPKLSTDLGTSAAAAVLTMLPIFLLGWFIQRYLVRGLTLGAVKG
jgi:multiple sugar transport system permease protein